MPVDCKKKKFCVVRFVDKEGAGSKKFLLNFLILWIFVIIKLVVVKWPV